VAVVLVGLALGGAPPEATDAPPESFTAEQRAHWAYQPIRRPEPPAVARPGWVRNPIDRFLLAGLEEVAFEPAREASRVELLRRIYADLTGLPPTPAQQEAFLRDERPDAYERLVDRLLASPQHGERWAQHWLDLAHYADSNGFELDADRPDAWRYRDWVATALNADMPYDRFVRMQVAGDRLAGAGAEGMIASGFARSGPREVVGGNVDPLVRRQTELAEITGTVGSVFLGLTMACARCHDHKFDAIPTTDYYRLQAYFAGSELAEVKIAAPEEEAAFKRAKEAIAKQVAPLKAAQAKLEAPYREALVAAKRNGLTDAERAVLAIPEKERTALQKKMAAGAQGALNVRWEEVAEAVARNPADHAERERLKREIDAIEQTLPPPPAHAMTFDEKTDAPETRVHRRGDPRSLGPRVGPRPPGVVLATWEGSESARYADGPPEGEARRVELARWLTDPANPLPARVIVNRLWQHHFGRGLVATPNDFGIRGEPPSHPELLDWLASELVRNGWRLKPIHRLIVTSSAYRQSTRPAEARQLVDDPENLYVSHMNRRRLDAEALRDAMLAVTGELNPAAGGPGVRVPIEKEVEELIFTEAEVVDLWPETPDPREHARRSLYLFRKRNVRYSLFDAFDAPDTQSACAQRNVSTHALQALSLLNSRFAFDRAEALAAAVRAEADSESARVERLYRRVLAREATAAERDRALRFVREQAARVGPDEADPEAAAWADLALALLNCNEFVYVP
jgi:cytochrome c551/c552